MQYYHHSNHQNQLNSQTSFSAENQQVWYPSLSPAYDQFNHYDIFSINPDNPIAFDVTNSNTLESSTWSLHANSAATSHDQTKIPETESAQPAAPKRTTKRVRNDRHSKICTSQGLRDRRMRLSVGVARKFFSLQDMLGFDKASRTVEWLMKQSESAIESIARCRLNQDVLESTSSLNSDHNSSASLNKKSRNLSNSKEFSSDHSTVVITKESRNMARARARERTREKSRNWSENSSSSSACKQDANNQLVCCQSNAGAYDEYCSPESLLSSWHLMFSNGGSFDDFFQEFSHHEVNY